MSRLLRARAMIDGRKYMTKPKPKIGMKNAKGCISYLLPNHSLASQMRLRMLLRALETEIQLSHGYRYARYCGLVPALALGRLARSHPRSSEAESLAVLNGAWLVCAPALCPAQPWSPSAGGTTPNPTDTGAISHPHRKIPLRSRSALWRPHNVEQTLPAARTSGSRCRGRPAPVHRNHARRRCRWWACQPPP